MASMASAVVSVAAVPAAASLRKDMESSIRSCSPAPSSFGAQKKPAAAAARQSSCVVRAAAEDQESWSGAKSAAAAAAIALVLSASPVQAKEGSGIFGLKFPDNEAGEASRNILADSKRKSDASFAEAQKTGKETTGQAASAGEAQPAISQVDPNAPEASDSIGDSIAARADAAADLAPGSGQQNGRTGANPIVKAFATPTRGLGDKEGENETNARNFMGQAKKPELPGNDQTYRQNTGISESIYNTFKSAGEGRDAGVGTKPQ